VLTEQKDVLALLRPEVSWSEQEINHRKDFVLSAVSDNGDLNDVLLADTRMVLPNDMLTKVDFMSMANSLEVRVPLLDFTVVNFAFSLPVSYKAEKGNGKKILKDAFADVLPNELFHRTKRGFEVPLLKWMKTGLNTLIEEQLLSQAFIEEQNIFNWNQIAALKQRLYSNNPGDVHATLWSLLVFQYWYKKYFLT